MILSVKSAGEQGYNFIRSPTLSRIALDVLTVQLICLKHRSAIAYI